MRVVVIGLGAIGGTVAAALCLGGAEVLGVARGAQLEAIGERGLRFRTPDADRVARLETVGSVAEVAFRPDDAIVIATKTQHVGAVLADLAAAGVSDQPIFCAQNGVESERMALRRFPNVHGVCVMLPAQYLAPGEVSAFGTPCHGIFDIGRYPEGSDADDRAMAEVLTQAGIASFVQDDVMASKYGKLLMNLGNVVEASLGPGPQTKPISAALRDEGRAVLAAAGVEVRDVGLDDPRREKFLKMGEIAGVARAGGSSTQSVLRGTGDIETDYLNGEIVLLGRLHGAAVEKNAWMCALARRMLREELRPGQVTPEEIGAALGIGR